MNNENFITGPQGELATATFNQAGSGQPCLFLHGDSGGACQWQGVAEQLSGRCFTFDFRGHGASEPASNGDYSLAGRAEDVGAVADFYDLDTFVLVAHSGGAAVALAYANQHPKRVAGIVFIEPASDPRGMPAPMREGLLAGLNGPGAVAMILGYYASIAGQNPSTLVSVQAAAEAVAPEARAGVAASTLGWNPEAAMNAFSGKLAVALVETGDTPEAVHHLKPGLVPTILPKGGHWVQVDDPDAVTEVIATFLQTLSVS